MGEFNRLAMLLSGGKDTLVCFDIEQFMWRIVLRMRKSTNRKDEGIENSTIEMNV